MKESRYGHKKGSLNEKTRWQEIKEAATDTATGTHALICPTFMSSSSPLK